MIQFNLHGNRQLQIEDDGTNRLRVIVLENGKEWVCRKEYIRKLADHLAADEAHIFKGRLQLLKHAGKISVEVKGEPIGIIDAIAFQQALKNLTLPA